MDTQGVLRGTEEPQVIETGQPLLDADWERARGRIPVDVDRLARETRALVRKRKIQSGGDLLRLLLAYSLCDWSFRQVGAWATLQGVGNLSEVAVRKRLLKARP